MSKRIYLSELKFQLENIEACLNELRDAAYEGAHSPTFLKKDRPEAKKLLLRRKEVRKQINEYRE